MEYIEYIFVFQRNIFPFFRPQQNMHRRASHPPNTHSEGSSRTRPSSAWGTHHRRNKRYYLSVGVDVCVPRGHKSFGGGTAPRHIHTCRSDVSPLILNQRGGLIHCRNRRGRRQCRRENARFSFRLMCGGVLLEQDVTALTIPGRERKKSLFFIEWQHRARPGRSVP